MSHRGGQDPQPGYMDEVCVKISEKYKPPPRINLAITYAQRLYLNKQIQVNIIPYDFSLEAGIKDRLKELRSTRKQLHEEKKDRLEKLKEARLKYEKSLEENKAKESIGNISKEAEVTGDQIFSPSCANTEAIYPTSYSHILTPTPLSNTDMKMFKGNPSDKSPFNISDFEADTSSPFDNMELKTINDIEELAQVLKKEETSNTYNIPDAMSQPYPNPYPSSSAHSTVSTYAVQDTHNVHYSPYASHYGHSIPATTYNNINGYYYNKDVILTNVNQNFRIDSHIYNFDSSSNKLSSKENVRSVPEMKALESGLEKTHICQNGVATVQGKSQDSCNERVIKSIDFDDAYNNLPKNLQYLSKDISLMGFPLSRVARVCQVLGDNQKKVVEHLLAMSELLDLGFSEEDVSQALLQSNNDRDKALDILIS